MPPLNDLIDAMISEAGICGSHDPAAAVEALPDLETRLRVLAFGSILEVFPLADRWQHLTGLALTDHWMFDPFQVAYKHSNEVMDSLKAEDIKGPSHNARVWWQVCQGVQGRFKGSFRDLIAANHDDVVEVQRYLFKSKTTFPVISGLIINARWLDLVHRHAPLPLKNWRALSVELSDTELEAAEALGMTREDAHPMLALALALWHDHCESLNPPKCGFTECPKRKS